MARILENTSKWELWGIRGKSVGEPMDDGDGKNPSGGIGHKWGGAWTTPCIFFKTRIIFVS